MEREFEIDLHSPHWCEVMCELMCGGPEEDYEEDEDDTISE